MTENCRVNDCQKRPLAAENERLRAALKRLLATINTSKAAEHAIGCGCVIHEAWRALGLDEQKASKETK